MTAAPLPYDLYALRRSGRRLSWRVRVSAVAVAVLIELSLARLLTWERTPRASLADLTPVMTVALVKPPATPKPPPPRPSLKGGHPKRAAPAPSKAQVRAPSNLMVASAAPAIERAPVIPALGPSASLSTLGTMGAVAGGGGSGSGAGAGAGAGAGTVSIYGVSWVRRPTEAELGRYYPSGVKGDVEGLVVLVCRIALDTHAHGCRVVAERPDGQGFGAAALEAAIGFRIRPPRVGGKPLDNARVAIPVYFGAPVPDAGG